MWEKIKLWTRVVVFSALAMYLLIVVVLNWGLVVEGELNLIFTKFYRPQVLTVLLVTSVLSVMGWWLIRTIFKTLRQFQTVRERSRTTKLEREMAEMRAKAGMLQKKDAAAGGAPGFPVVPIAPVNSTGTGSASVPPSAGDAL